MGDKYNIKEGIQKFPSFHYKQLNDIISKQDTFTKETTIDTLKSLKNIFEQLEKEINNIIETNLNNFNTQSSTYDRKTYYYIIMSSFNVLCCELILYKLDSKNNENFKFDSNEYLEELKNKFGTNPGFDNLLKRLKILTGILDNILISKHNCAISFLNISFNYLIYFVKEILGQIKVFKEIKINSDSSYSLDNEKILLNLLFNLEKLFTVGMFLGHGYFIDENDIFNQTINSEDWKNITRISYEVICSGVKDIQKIFKDHFYDSEKYVATLLNTYSENSFGITNAASFLSKYYIYGKFPLLMEVESKKALLLQHKNITYELMNIVRWPIFKKITERDFPSIKYRKKFYIKKEYPDISLEYIQNLLKLMGNKYIDVSNLKQEIIYKTNEDIINNKEIPKDELYNIKPPKHLKKYYVSATLLHSSNLEFLEDQPSIFNPFSYFQSPPSKPENLIIFIHGGGFIGMSTHSHEVFLRDWVNRLNIPIIGLNYGLSPQYKYPYGLNDCYQGYRWIINHCEDVIGFKPKKIILGGDSSGGTLILSLIYLLIAKNEFENENIRIPDLLLPLYPCCNTSIKNMGASLLLTLKDFLLNDSFLIMVNEAYRAFYENDDDPFLDPVKAKECLLKKLPKTVFQFGSFDPLRDDIVRLLAKIGKIKELDVKAYEFKEYCHGWNGGVNSEFLLKIPRELLFLEIKDIL